MSYVCEVLFNDISQGTVTIHPGEYPEEAAKFMMLHTDTKKCKHVTILCEAINARYELYDCFFDIFGSFIRTIYGYDLRPPYNQSDGMKVFNQHRMQCDHRATLKHHTCFRPFYEYIYDQRGVPILSFCEKHYPKRSVIMNKFDTPQSYYCSLSIEELQQEIITLETTLKNLKEEISLITSKRLQVAQREKIIVEELLKLAKEVLVFKGKK